LVASNEAGDYESHSKERATFHFSPLS
jgi:hypothetical protein